MIAWRSFESFSTILRDEISARYLHFSVSPYDGKRRQNVHCEDFIFSASTAAWSVQS